MRDVIVLVLASFGAFTLAVLVFVAIGYVFAGRLDAVIDGHVDRALDPGPFDVSPVAAAERVLADADRFVDWEKRKWA